ncbi:MAG TPA: hypothetical protein VFK89_12580, partial [Actinomycetota bacterium]|nr:hypothetical protein [Actinomycetota bacterium]
MSSTRSGIVPAVLAALLVAGDVFAGIYTGVDLIAVSFILFGLVGALIMWRQPDNKMGWVFVGIGYLSVIGAVTQGYVENNLPGNH